MPIFFGCQDENAHCCQMKNRSPPPRIQCCLGKHNKNLWTHTVTQRRSQGSLLRDWQGRTLGTRLTVPVPKLFVLIERVDCILGLQPRDEAAMLGVNTIEFFFEKFTWKQSLVAGPEERNAGLKISDSRSPVLMTGQIFFIPDKPQFWPVKIL